MTSCPYKENDRNAGGELDCHIRLIAQILLAAHLLRHPERSESVHVREPAAESKDLMPACSTFGLAGDFLGKRFV